MADSSHRLPPLGPCYWWQLDAAIFSRQQFEVAASQQLQTFNQTRYASSERVPTLSRHEKGEVLHCSGFSLQKRERHQGSVSTSKRLKANSSYAPNFSKSTLSESLSVFPQGESIACEYLVRFGSIWDFYEQPQLLSTATIETIPSSPHCDLQRMRDSASSPESAAAATLFRQSVPYVSDGAPSGEMQAPPEEEGRDESASCELSSDHENTAIASSCSFYVDFPLVFTTTGCFRSKIQGGED